MAREITLNRKAKSGSPAVWLVTNNCGDVCGIIEKSKNTKYETHPYKAFWVSPVSGSPNEMIAVFYPHEVGSTGAAFQLAADAIFCRLDGKPVDCGSLNS